MLCSLFQCRGQVIQEVQNSYNLYKQSALQEKIFVHTDKNVYLTLTYNGINVPLKCKAEVEGWKLVEGTMDLSVLGHVSSLNISIVPNTGTTIYIDDIRMQKTIEINLSSVLVWSRAAWTNALTSS